MSNERESGTIGQIIARRTGERYTISLDSNAWTNVLALLDYARSCAALEHDDLMEQGAQEMLEALRQAEEKNENQL